MARISPDQVKPEFLRMIDCAKEIEPQLASRLQEVNRWIKDKPTGLLKSKKVLLNFLLELLNDTSLWLSFKKLSLSDQALSRKAMSPVEQYWHLDLFNRWFSDPDPKLNKWKGEILKAGCRQDDGMQISELLQEIERIGGKTINKIILDFSMATDLVVCGHQMKSLCIQMTTLSPAYIEKKEERWRITLDYWKIKRGLFISYDPSGHYKDSKDLGKLIVEESNSRHLEACQDKILI